MRFQVVVLSPSEVAVTMKGLGVAKRAVGSQTVQGDRGVLLSLEQVGRTEKVQVQSTLADAG